MIPGLADLPPLPGVANAGDAAAAAPGNLLNDAANVNANPEAAGAPPPAAGAANNANAAAAAAAAAGGMGQAAANAANAAVIAAANAAAAAAAVADAAAAVAVAADGGGGGGGAGAGAAGLGGLEALLAVAGAPGLWEQIPPNPPAPGGGAGGAAGGGGAGWGHAAAVNRYHISFDTGCLGTEQYFNFRRARNRTRSNPATVRSLLQLSMSELLRSPDLNFLDRALAHDIPKTHFYELLLAALHARHPRAIALQLILKHWPERELRVSEVRRMQQQSLISRSFPTGGALGEHLQAVPFFFRDPMEKVLLNAFFSSFGNVKYRATSLVLCQTYNEALFTLQ